MKLEEAACTIELGGQHFTAGGAYVDEQRAWVYLDKGKVTTWHGDVIGSYKVVSEWTAYTHNACFKMNAVRIILLDGTAYNGRYNPDSGSFVKARRYK